jgi:hypothetical protein
MWPKGDNLCVITYSAQSPCINRKKAKCGSGLKFRNLTVIYHVPSYNFQAQGKTFGQIGTRSILGFS